MALVIGAVAGPALAVEQPLLRGQVAHLAASATGGRARVLFRGTADYTAANDPRCPATSSLRIVTAADQRLDIPLPCANWHKRRSGYVYTDPSGAAAGVRRVIMRGDVLLMRFSGSHFAPISGPLALFEAALSIGDESACGRFSTFQRNRADSVRAIGPTERCRFPRPNFIVIVLDDARYDGVDQMQVVQTELVPSGVPFNNGFVSNAICCPSRASILTGEYSVRHGTHQIAGDLGGAHVFRETGADQHTIATWLQAAGYRTGLFGKYLNGYAATEQNQGPGGTFYIPPGWDRWWAFVSPEHYGGVNGSTYRIVDENAQVTVYNDHSTDAQYSTDVSANELRQFVADAVAEGRPFFAYWAPYAPHGETPQIVPVPAVRHTGLFDGLAPWRPPSWNEDDLSDKPRWVESIRTSLDNPNGAIIRAVTDVIRQTQYESLLAVDENLGTMMDDLAALGVDQDTFILFTSDNGLGWGDHQLWGVKEAPYEEIIRAPFVVRYPRRVAPVAGGIPNLAVNIDIAPTVAAFADAPMSIVPDGESLVNPLLGLSPTSSRNEFMIEHFSIGRNAGITYTGQVTDGDALRLFYGDPRAQPRASLVFEFDVGDGVTGGWLPVVIGTTDDQTIANLLAAINANVPEVIPAFNTTANTLTLRPSNLAQASLYFWKEIDQGEVISVFSPMPEYFGLRDVGAGLTWVEYETGERELYDLNVDPDQLANKADDPAYAATRQSLAARLATLLQQVQSR